MITTEKKPHVHAELIKAWADGAVIQAYDPVKGTWIKIRNPEWHGHIKYRVKPIDDIRYALMLIGCAVWNDDNPNIKLTFDGATGKLKTAEVI